MANASLITPVMALVLWTLVIWAWMVATRIPAMQKAGIEPQDAARTSSLDLPAGIMQISDNYNHLMEQPTVFYATALATQVAGLADDLAVSLAWSYVVLRVVHSLVQCTINNVMIRFTLFSLSTIVLVVLAARTTLGIL